MSIEGGGLRPELALCESACNLQRITGFYSAFKMIYPFEALVLHHSQGFAAPVARPAVKEVSFFLVERLDVM